MRLTGALAAAAAAAVLLGACNDGPCHSVASYGVDDDGQSFSRCDEAPASTPTR